MEIKVLSNILGVNDQLAEENRKMLDSSRTIMVNLMSSPGAGKTSLILQTIEGLKTETRIGVIEGDVSSSIDAERIAREGIPTLQINTGGDCHLDANMIRSALGNMPLEDIDLLFVENVGNLICTAEFSLGEHKRVVLAHTPEGDDKPHKYPLMFTNTDVVIINKTDLLPHVSFDTASYIRAVAGLNENVEVFQISCTTGQGVDRWLSWLQKQLGLS